MCKKTNYHKTSNTQIDKCIRELITNFNWMLQNDNYTEEPNWKIVACCCGHGKYPMTIVAKDQKDMVLEMYSGKYLHRKRNFYKKDKSGYYYIPEVLTST